MKLGRYVLKHWKSYLTAIIFVFVSMGLELAFPQVTKVIINEVFLGGDDSRFLQLLIAIVVIGIGMSVFGYYREFIFDRNCITVGTEIRKDLFKHIQTLSLDYFDDTNTGELMARVKDDVDKVFQMVGMIAMVGLIIIINCVGILFLMFRENWKLALIPFVAMVIAGVVAVIMEKKLDAVYEEISEENATLTTIAEENLAGVRMVKAFAREKYEIEKFRVHNKRYSDLNMKEARTLIKYYPVFQLLGMLLPVMVAVIGGISVINGNMSLGSLSMFVLYARNCTGPMEELGWVTNELSSAIASLKKIKKIYKENSTLKAVIDPVKKDHIDGCVTFDHVSLTLQDQEILKDISFKLEPGKTLGIMGETGSGKSTIINLLQRFYDPTEGSIFLDDTPITDMDLLQVRGASAVVMQDVFLFSDSIEENIRMGRREDMTLTEIKRAAQMAKAHDFIDKLDDKYETVIGERGVGLSGGQKQRISIARALSKNAPILVLDDSTSALDMETEREIQKTLDEITGVTRIVVAHRISAVRKADEIIYLKDGEIAERGTHETLLKKKGLYYATYMAQYGSMLDGEVSA